MAEKRLVLIHGRSFKPEKQVLKRNWLRAIRLGLVRDYGENSAKVRKFDQVKAKAELAYYGKESNDFLRSKGKNYDEAADRADRLASLARLAAYDDKSEFIGRKGKRNYKDLPGQSGIGEAIADIFGAPVNWFGLSDELVKSVAPDMAHYWNPDSVYGSAVRWKLTEPLRKAMAAQHDILLISHSLGTMISFDVLWKFSYYGEYQALREKGTRVRWVTLGSPLGDGTVKERLKGARASGTRRYPTNIRTWDNFAAEDDFVAHDQDVKNDYKKMQREGMLDSIADYRTYNLSTRAVDETALAKRKSNPHHAAGYLIEPSFTKLVADWL